MSAAAAAILGESAITAPVVVAFAALVALLDWARQPAKPPAPRARHQRASVRRTERELAPDPATVARDAGIIDAWQRGEIPGRHAPGGVR